MSKAMKILIADDEEDLRKYVAHILKTEIKDELEISEASNGQEVEDQCAGTHFDLIILDVKMPVKTGLEALREIKDQIAHTHVVIFTAHANVKDAVTAIKEGAYDYLEKPIDKNRVVEVFNQALEAKKLVEEIALSRPIMESDTESEIIGQSQTMKNVFDLIKKISDVDSTVLLRGENGTGKELVAKAIHFNSPRKNHPFVAINCAAIPEELVESELFGHEKGAFTGATERKIGKFQAANQGTLFLDEIGELKTEIQAKLLRALQDKTFMPLGSNRIQKSNTRIIAATNLNLEKQILEKKFREDLFFRLNVMPIFIPPLRERSEDIPYLVEHFIKKYKANNQNLTMSEDALSLLKKYSWPGNIRELENTIQRALIYISGNVIDLSGIPDEIKNSVMNQGQTGLDFEKFKVDSEKSFIIKALKANDGKINKTVANANIPKNTLLRKIKKYNINVKELGEN